MSALRVDLRISLTVDAETWAAEYGVEPSAVRRDVREYVRNALLGMPVAPTNVDVRAAAR